MDKAFPFIDNVKKGFRIILKSLKFSFEHKQLLFFPLLTASLIVSSIGLYDAFYYHLNNQHITAFISKENIKKSTQNKVDLKDSKNENPLEYVIFLYFITFISTFIFTFCNVALSYAASQAFRGESINISQSLKMSIKKIKTIFSFSFFAFFIHLLINIFKGKKKNNPSAFLTNLVGEAINLAWYFATFLVIPIVAHEDYGAFQTIKRSAHLMKNAFGSNLVIAMFLPQLVIIILFVLSLVTFGVLLTLSVYIFTIISVTLPISLLKFIVLLYIAFTGIIYTFISNSFTIFKTAAYYFTIGSPVGPFSTEEIHSSIITEPKK